MPPNTSAFGYTLARLARLGRDAYTFTALLPEVEETGDATHLLLGFASLEERGVVTFRPTIRYGGAIEITLLPKGRREARAADVQAAARSWAERLANLKARRTAGAFA